MTKALRGDAVGGEILAPPRTGPTTRRRLLTPVDRPVQRVAMVSLHTSPLDQPGTGDAGGMNVYVLELSKQLAQQSGRQNASSQQEGQPQPG